MVAIGALSAGELRLPKPGDDVVPGRFVVVMRQDAAAAPARSTTSASRARLTSATTSTAASITELTGASTKVIGENLGVVVVDFAAVAPQADGGLEQAGTAGKSRAATSGAVASAPADDAGISADVVAQLETLAAMPGVEVVEPDYRRHLSAHTPSDPRVGELYYFNNISATTAFSASPSGNPPVVVAILDDGVYYDHPDLAGRLWTNVDEIYGDSIDNDGNGYVDDVFGYDFANRDAIPRPDFSIEDNSWESHGTHLAGTIAATRDNGIGIAGMSGNVELMVCKFFGNGPNGGSISGVTEGINYAVNNGAKLINCSFGGTGKSLAEERAIEYARSRGVLLVCAAGNGTNNEDIFSTYPGSFPQNNVISVAASDRNDNLTSFSNFGSVNVDLAAPGAGILSTVVMGTPNAPRASYESWSGTSMAAPIVTGAIATILDQSPDLTVAELRSALLRSVDPISNLTNRVASGGRLNVSRFLTVSNPVRSSALSAEYNAAAYNYSYQAYVNAYYGYVYENSSVTSYYAFVYAYYAFVYADWANAYLAWYGHDATYRNVYRYGQASSSWYAYHYGTVSYAEQPGSYQYTGLLNSYVAYVYGWAEFNLY